MPRSLKKGPYIDSKLEKKIKEMNKGKKKKVIKTWSRRSTVSPLFVGHTFAVHNGNKFIPVFISENMVGHKLGEFSQPEFSGSIQEIEKHNYGSNFQNEYWSICKKSQIGFR